MFICIGVLIGGGALLEAGGAEVIEATAAENTEIVVAEAETLAPVVETAATQAETAAAEAATAEESCPYDFVGYHGTNTAGAKFHPSTGHPRRGQRGPAGPRVLHYPALGTRAVLCRKCC